MSTELVDFRGKITVETRAMLEGEAAITGDENSVIVRKILHAWAMKKLHAHRVAQKWLAVEGHAAVGQGGTGMTS